MASFAVTIQVDLCEEKTKKKERKGPLHQSLLRPVPKTRTSANCILLIYVRTKRRTRKKRIGITLLQTTGTRKHRLHAAVKKANSKRNDVL